MAALILRVPPVGVVAVVFRRRAAGRLCRVLHESPRGSREQLEVSCSLPVSGYCYAIHTVKRLGIAGGDCGWGLPLKSPCVTRRAPVPVSGYRYISTKTSVPPVLRRHLTRLLSSSSLSVN